MLPMSDLRHAGVAPAQAASGTPLQLSPHFPLILSPTPFSSLLSSCWGYPKLNSCWSREQVLKSPLFFFPFFSVKCNSCSLVILFSEYPLLDGALAPFPDPSPAQLHKEVSEVAKTAFPPRLGLALKAPCWCQFLCSGDSCSPQLQLAGSEVGWSPLTLSGGYFS